MANRNDGLLIRGGENVKQRIKVFGFLFLFLFWFWFSFFFLKMGISMNCTEDQGENVKRVITEFQFSKLSVYGGRSIRVESKKFERLI